MNLTKPKNHKQAVWDVLCSGQGWLDLAAITKQADVSETMAKGWLAALQKGGFVEIRTVKAKSGQRKNIFLLIRDAGREAPRLNADGSARADCHEEVMWRTMKILKSFDLPTLNAHLAMTHDIPQHRVARYVLALEKAGYLKNTGSQRDKQLVLAKNTGARHPQVIVVTEIYDPNTDEIVLRDVPNYE